MTPAEGKVKEELTVQLIGTGAPHVVSPAPLMRRESKYFPFGNERVVVAWSHWM